MSDHGEDDKPTVVLDLHALKKQKLKQEEDLASVASTLEFVVGTDILKDPTLTTSGMTVKTEVTIVLFDFQTDFFQQNLDKFPKGHNYKIVTTVPELNQHLKSKNFQIVVFNYDVNPKAVNQLCAQIKQKLPSTKTMIMARAISPEKAKLHAQTLSGASGYYQFPLDAQKVEKAIFEIHSFIKKVG